MNEQDREVLAELKAHTYGHEDLSYATVTRIESRLTHLDDLEKAVEWIGTVEVVRYLDHWRHDRYVRGMIETFSERHDGTPSGRAEALVRLWRMVTGGGE